MLIRSATLKMSKKNNSEDPIKKISYGNVTGSIFINEDRESGNKWFSVSVQKFYNSETNKKKDKIWAYTNSYNANDLQYLNLVQTECFKYMVSHKPDEEE